MLLREDVNAEADLLTLTGKRDSQARKPVQTAIENATLALPHQIILNFSNVFSMESVSFGPLMLAHATLEVGKICLLLVVSEGYVRHVPTLASIGKTIPISTFFENCEFGRVQDLS